MVARKPTVPIFQPGHPLARGLEAAWTFHEGCGTELRSMPYYGIDDTNKPERLFTLSYAGTTPTWSVSRQGRVVDFDGTSSDYFSLGATPLKQTDNWTLVCKFRPDDLTTNRRIVFDLGSSSNGFAIASSGNTAGYVGGLFGGVAWLTTSTQYTLGEWCTVAMVRSSGTTFFYYNGAKLSYTTTSTPDTPSDATYIAYDNGNSKHVGPVSFAAVYSRPISTREAMRLHVDPWEMFRSPRHPGALFTTAAGGTSTAALSWTDNSDNESGFSIERSTTSATAGFAEIDTVGAGVTSYNDSGLAADTYWYRVRSYDAAGRYSDYSNVAEVTVS